MAVRALLGCRLALAVAPRRRLRAAARSRSSARSRCSPARVLVLPAALVAGIVLQRLWPGDFDYGLRHGGPALATWIALFGGVAALVVGRCAASTVRERHGLGAAAPSASRCPVFVHGAWHWSPRARATRCALSPRLVHRLRTVVPKGAVVIAPVADELPGHRRRAGLRRRAAGPHVAEHEGERPVRPGSARSPLGADERPAASRGATAPPGRFAAAVSIV